MLKYKRNDARPGFKGVDTLRGFLSRVFTTQKRHVLLVSSLVIVLLPSAPVLIIYSIFKDGMYQSGMSETKRLTAYVQKLIPRESLHTGSRIVEGSDVALLDDFSNNFDAYNMRIFSKNGNEIYSMRDHRIGFLNSNPYFENIVKRGSVFQKIVEKGKLSASGSMITTDVVETYIPIMEGGIFIGAVEVYMDITDSMNTMRKILGVVAAVSLVLGFSLLAVVVLVDRRAVRSESESLVAGLQAAGKHAHEERRACEERYRVLAETVGDAVYLVDARGRIADANHEAQRQTGYSRSELLRLAFAEMEAGIGATPFELLRERILTMPGKVFQANHRRKGGGIHPVEFRASEVERGGRQFLLVLIRDLSKYPTV